MCDYSLMGVPNRLAVEGEVLVVHRFETGTLGLASPSDLLAAASAARRPASLRERMKSFFGLTETDTPPAVCVPPGARLMVHDIPISLQHALGIGAVEVATFTQIAASGIHRDAIRFVHGRQIRLQDLCEGQRMRVLDLSCAEDREPVTEEALQW
jgi:hypothetical protein